MKSIRWMTAILILAGQAGCAFRQDLPQASSVQAAAPMGQPASVQGHLQVSWHSDQAAAPGGEDPSFTRTASGTGSSLSVGVPLVIPASVPDSMTLSLVPAVAKSSQVDSITVRGWIGAEGGAIFPLSVSQESASGGGFSFLVAGISQLLPSNQEGTATLQIALNDAEGTALEKWTIPIATPPSALDTSQATVADFVAAGGTLDPSLKVVRPLADEFALLQIITVNNRSLWPVELDWSARLSGSLASHNKQVTLAQAPCSYTTSTEESDASFADVLVAVPLTSDLASAFSQKLSDSIARGGWSMVVAPGETRLIGIYGAGESAVTLATQGHSAEKFSIVQAITGCQSQCGTWNGPHSEAWGMGHASASEYWQARGWPGASLICNGIGLSRPVPNGPALDENALNQCAAWEESTGAKPWDVSRFCLSNAPGNRYGYPSDDAWIINKTTVPINVGTQTGPVMLKLAPESSVVRVRYRFEGVTENSPTREFNGFIQSAKQAD